MRRTHLIAVLVGLVPVVIFATDASAFYHPGMGVFMSRDPGAGTGGPMRIGTGGASPVAGFVPMDPTAQYADGPNLYQYVQSNPINLVDPDGRKARVSVDEKNCAITVTVNIGIYGAKASDALAQTIKNSIESRWNGNSTKKGCKDSDPGGCQVSVVANVKYYKDAKHWWSVSEDNQIKITGETTRSWVGGVGGTYGRWEDTEDWAYAHETGHLMGFDDDYSYWTGKPHKGHEGHMMGEYGGTVVQYEIDGILQGQKCPKSCCCKSP